MFFKEKDISQKNYQAIVALFFVVLVNYIYYYKAVVGSQLHVYAIVIISCCYLTAGWFCFRSFITKWNFVFLLTCISFLISSCFSTVTGFGFCIYFLLGVILLFSLSLNEQSQTYIVQFSLYFSLMYVIITLYSVLFTSGFLSNLSLFYADPQLSIVGYLTQSKGYAGIAGHTGQNGFFISVIVGILFVRFFYQSNRDIWTFVLFLLSFVTLLFTVRRGPLLGNIVAATLVLFFFFYKSGSFGSSFIIFLLFAIALYFVSLYVPQFSEIFRKNDELMQNRDITNGRLDLYDFAIYLFEKKPWFGHGPLTYTLLRQNYLGDSNVILSAHNSYIQMLAETGIVGAVLFISCLLVVLYQSMASLKYALKMDTGDQVIIAISLYVQLVFIVLNFSESIAIEFQILYTYFLFASIPLYYYRKYYG